MNEDEHCSNNPISKPKVLKELSGSDKLCLSMSGGHG